MSADASVSRRVTPLDVRRPAGGGRDDAGKRRGYDASRTAADADGRRLLAADGARRVPPAASTHQCQVSVQNWVRSAHSDLGQVSHRTRSGQHAELGRVSTLGSGSGQHADLCQVSMQIWVRSACRSGSGQTPRISVRSACGTGSGQNPQIWVGSAHSDLGQVSAQIWVRLALRSGSGQHADMGQVKPPASVSGQHAELGQVRTRRYGSGQHTQICVRSACSEYAHS